MIFLLLGYQSVYAETITVDVDVKSFYTKGREAYEKGRYVDALKYLFVFKLLSQNELKKQLKLSHEVNMAIFMSELALHEALVSKEKMTEREVNRNQFKGSGGKR